MLEDSIDQHLRLTIIHLVITLVAEIVISGIFNSCDGEDQNQRHNGGEPGQGGDLWDQLQNEKEQEVGIGNFLELLKEVDRQEGENIVLRGLDAVTRILEFLIVFSVIGPRPPFFFCNRIMLQSEGHTRAWPNTLPGPPTSRGFTEGPRFFPQYRSKELAHLRHP